MQKNRLSLVGGGMGGGYTTTGYWLLVLLLATRYSYIVSSIENCY